MTRLVDIDYAFIIPCACPSLVDTLSFYMEMSNAGHLWKGWVFMGSRNSCEELFIVLTKSVENTLNVKSLGLWEGQASGYFGFCMFTQFLYILCPWLTELLTCSDFSSAWPDNFLAWTLLSHPHTKSIANIDKF